MAWWCEDRLQTEEQMVRDSRVQVSQSELFDRINRRACSLIAKTEPSSMAMSMAMAMEMAMAMAKRLGRCSR